VEEASGLAAGRRNPGILFTHNDAGNDAFLYAFYEDGEQIGKRTSTRLIPSLAAAKIELEGIENRDYEDIAVGPGPEPDVWYIYISDTGELTNVTATLTAICSGNNDFDRDFLTIYRLPEPDVAGLE